MTSYTWLFLHIMMVDKCRPHCNVSDKCVFPGPLRDLGDCGDTAAAWELVRWFRHLLLCHKNHLILYTDRHMLVLGVNTERSDIIIPGIYVNVTSKWFWYNGLICRITSYQQHDMVTQDRSDLCLRLKGCTVPIFLPLLLFTAATRKDQKTTHGRPKAFILLEDKDIVWDFERF